MRSRSTAWKWLFFKGTNFYYVQMTRETVVERIMYLNNLQAGGDVMSALEPA
jgi:hypothetical protein